MLGRNIFIGFSCWILFSCENSSSIDQIDTLINRAVSGYDGGNYEMAISLYESALNQDFRNGHILYNLGNAFYKSQRKGAAMAAFLAARRYLPRDPDIKANLRLVEKSFSDKLSSQLPKPGWYEPFNWTGSFTFKELTYAAVVCFALGCLIFGFSLWNLRFGWLRGAAFCVWIIFIILGAGLIFKSSIDANWGAVDARSAQVYSGPNKITNPVLFEISEGAPVAVGGRKPQWYKIKLSDGKSGWIEQHLVKLY